MCGYGFCGKAVDGKTREHEDSLFIMFIDLKNLRFCAQKCLVVYSCEV